MVAMWKQGRGLGAAYSQRGHEAISVGAAAALGPDDVVAPMHRDLGCYLARGLAPARILGNMLGRVCGVTGGRDPHYAGMGDLSLASSVSSATFPIRCPLPWALPWPCNIVGSKACR